MPESVCSPEVFDAFFDDAAVFPPGRAPLGQAVPDHIARRGTPLGRLVGPLLLPVDALDAAASLVDATGEGPLRVGVVVPAGGLDVALAAVERVAPAIRVGGLELKTDDLDPRQVVADAAALTERYSVHVELAVPHIRAGLLDSFTGTDVRLKARTGGLVAEAFPSVEDLAEVITTAVAAKRSFKLTAGLHRAVRYRDDSTGFVHHGFLNIAVATGEALDGADTAAVATTLAETDGSVLAERLRAIAAQWRTMFESFGTCSIAEPLDTLDELDLIPNIASDHGN
ncbi:hypothetical protein M1M07_27900 [Rhodococcus sp. HM1]|uniref:hypothetical protein n=1 Tax=unclassified Rhodococcus (in: high G+C Gram-positive bacteria) TaxID=192944 RepID=UPI0018CCB831|nr:MULTISPECIES: hypothetical protein [unclassified Rhodococcus (in: high G+C Gram-positive bacteria)]MBH0118047.1 hypothetical protein [Rhodococcus sp. CX]MCK8674919.1 hypothetical protein [Rhodococcus sp. HM1]